MNKDQIKGRAETAKGKAKEVTGKAVRNRRLENEGKVDQIAGKTQSGL
ncbi:MAG: CsbD family protein, partial [Betaproteobacteria bacterium]